MLVTRCVDCGHEELTFNSDCRCGCHSIFTVPASLQVKDGTTSSLLDRIAALEAQLAEEQARLAMLVGAAKVYLKEETSMCTSPGERAVRNAIDATAPAVAEFVASVERRGAVKANNAMERIHAIVTRLLAEPGNHTEQLVEIATICEARADELEGE